MTPFDNGVGQKLPVYRRAADQFLRRFVVLEISGEAGRLRPRAVNGFASGVY